MVNSLSDNASPEDTSDLSALAWVLDETRKSLQGVSKSLKRFAQDAEEARGVDLASVDASQLRLARQQLHQVGGALDMVGQTVAARMVHAMETAVQRFVAQPETCTVPLAAQLEKSGFALVEFVENQLSAAPRPALGLFPQYQQVLKLAGVDRIHPADLWPQRWRWAKPVLPAAAQPLSCSDAVRKRLDHSVLRLMKHGDVNAAAELSTVSHGLSTGSDAARPKAFWALAAGFFQALAQALVPMDMYAKRAASRVLLQYTSLSRGETLLSERLALDLLFYCAQAQPESAESAPLLTEVRCAWGLERHQAIDYTRPVFGLYDPSVLAQSRRRIEAAKESWSALAGGDLTRLRASVDQFGLVNESLLKLHPGSRPLVDALAQCIDQLQQSGRVPAPELAIEVATAVLFLEASLAEYNPDDAAFTARIHELSGRLQQVRQGQALPELAPWMEQLYRSVSDRQTMGTVVSELRVSLAEIEQKLDQYFRQPDDAQLLESVPMLMGQMRGVLSVLGLDQAATAVARMRDQIEAMGAAELPAEPAALPDTFEKLGNSLGALGFLLDTLSYQPALARQLFYYDEQDQEFKYLGGRRAAQRVDDSQAAALDSELPEDDEALALGATPEQLDRMAAQAALDERPALAQAARQAAQAARAQDQVSLDQALLALQDMAEVPATASAAAAEEVQPSSLPPEDATGIDAELLEIFLEEAGEVVSNGLAAVEVLASAPSDEEQLTTLRRAFHTLKGSSRMVGLNEFGEAAWAMEQLLNAWLAEGKPAEPSLRAVASQALQAFGHWTADLAGAGAGHWRAQPFQTLAEGLRVQGEHLSVDLEPLAAGLTAPEAELTSGLMALAGADAPETPIEGQDTSAAVVPELPDVEPVLDQEPGEVQEPRQVEASAPAAPALPPPENLLAAFDLPDLDLPDFELDEPVVLDDSQLSDTGLDADALDLAADDELSLRDVQQVARELGADSPAAGQDWGELSSGFDSVLDQELDLSDFDAALSSFAGLGAPVSSPSATEAPREPQRLDLDLPDLRLDVEWVPEPSPEQPVDSAPASLPELATDMAEAPDWELDLGESVSTDGLDLPLDVSLDMPLEVSDADAHPVFESASDFELGGEDADEGVTQVGELSVSTPLFEVYLDEARGWSEQLQSELSSWADQLHEPVPDLAVARAHSLAGSSGTVGFKPLSELARALEHALLRLQNQAQGTSDQVQSLRAGAQEIERVLQLFGQGHWQQPDSQVLADLQALEPHGVPSGLAGLAADDATSLSVWPGADEAHSFELSPDDVYLSELPQGEDEADSTPVPELVPDVPEPMLESAAPSEPHSGLAGLDVLPLALPVSALVRDIDEAIDAVDAIDPDLFPIFEEEAEELLPQLTAALRRWQEQPEALDARAQALRVLHTLKGSARLAGAMRLGEMAHHAESSIEALGMEGVSASDISPVIEELDRIEHDFQALRERVSTQSWTPQPEADPLVSAVPEPATAVETEVPDAPRTSAAEAVTGEEAVAGPAGLSLVAARASARQTVRVQAQLLDRMLAEAGEVMTSRVRLDADMLQLRASLNELGSNVERLRMQLRDIELQAETQMQSRMAQSKDEQQNFDPLEFDRFTRMQELSRMMAESVNDVATVQRNLQRAVESSEDALVAQARQSRELQRNLLRTRMVEFDGIAERLYRVVRQASKESEKQVRLDIVGGNIEVDRGILDRMTPAFEHLLRNSVVHGIELPQVRQSHGKDETGVITIEVQQSGNDVSIAFRDDGAGLNIERIRQRAIERGLLAESQGLSEAEAGQMIFTPGFTTATDLTGLAGRGVGMDVVRTEVQALGGRIETETRVGQGSVFRLVLPLTTAVTHVVMLRAGERMFGVPANLIEVVLRASQAEIEQARRTHEFSHGGATLPFFWAGALLQHSQASTEVGGRTLPAVVLRSADQRIVLHVDEVLGNQEVVVKALGPQMSRLPGLVAITALASGAVALIYNPVALAAVFGEQVRTAAQHSRDEPAATTAATAAQQPTVAASASAIPLVLVVDDSITVRRVTQRLLQREGYRVALAADGLDGLTRLREERPVVVLSDIEMPRMDGFDFLRNIRADEQWADLPVVMITSRIAEKHREHARQLGANHYLGKPYSEDELLALVSAYAQAAAQGADTQA